MKRFENISNSELRQLVNEWVKSERDRVMVSRRLIDGICFDQLAEEFHLSVRQTKNIIYKAQDQLFRHI